MKHIQAQQHGILELLEDEHQQALKQIEQLDIAIVGLQFEGKTSMGRHVKQIGSILQFFLRRFIKHMEREERVIFPFLSSHIPRLVSVFPLLCSQHNEFKKSAKDLQLLIHGLSNDKANLDQTRTIQKFCEVGTYLIYLLRHHIEVEYQTIYKMINCELRRDEKEELETRLKNRKYKNER